MKTREHRLRVSGRFEPVAMALSTLRDVTVAESTEAHVLFTLPRGGGAGLARPRPRHGAEPEVELLLIGATAGAATALRDLLRSILDYTIVDDEHEDADSRRPSLLLTARGRDAAETLRTGGLSQSR